MGRVDLVLVNPNNKKAMFGPLSELASSEPPLWIGLTAGFLRSKGFGIRIIDADAEGWGPEETMQEIAKVDPLVVAVGALGANPSASSTPKMPASRSLLELLKVQAPQIKTILFGIHPASLPEKTLQEEAVDYVCRGEAFSPFMQLLNAIKSANKSIDQNIKGLWYRQGNRIVDNGWADQIANLDELPFVAWDMLPMDKYKAHNWHCFGHIKERSPYAVIYTSLGCIFNCTYCNIHDLYGEKPGMRYRSPENVIEEIDLLVKTYKVRNIKFLDELFVMGTSDRLNKRIERICDLLIERDYNLNIWAYARIDTVNEEILKKVKRAGINWICYGIEGGNKGIRDKVSKGQFDGDRISRAVGLTHDTGIHILGNFMFGLPGDTLETMQETFDMAKGINCAYANFYCTMAYPGSKLYDDSIAQGINLPQNWMAYSQYGPDTRPMPTKYLSSADVLRFRDNAFMEYYTSPSYLNMIEQKFGLETLGHIKQMTRHKVNRKILDDKISFSAANI